VTRREDAVHAKGKGVLETFWIVPKAQKGSSVASGMPKQDDVETSLASVKEVVDRIDKESRMIDWVVAILLEHIKKIVAQNAALGAAQQEVSSLLYTPTAGTMCLDEVAEVISLPEFNNKAGVAIEQDSQNVSLSHEVIQQLRACVSVIASTYHNNQFHNFEHACHVTMSVDKFLKRMASPDLDPNQTKKDAASQLHDYTHGINSDPLAIFAIVFSALVHDMDHRGVSNAQLIKEEKEMATMYQNKSVAEQNSFDIAWSLLMEDQFSELRQCLFANKGELVRFRQVCVNVVLATDIFDKELNDLRKARWNRAFSNDQEGGNNASTTHETANLRATIVIEHIIQASDVSHTMQHWHVYRKWNARLFHEMMQAYRSGRMGMDPSTFWYQGELSFFDNYIIPLAKKLKECNVFGVSSDECLTYAMANRAEWEQRGQQLLEEMMKE
jgi:hypothetical protein